MTLTELETSYSVEDLYDLHEAMEIQEALQEEAMNKNKPKSTKK